VSEAGGRLKAGRKLELPAEGNGVVQEAFQIVGRTGVSFGFDLEPLPVEGATAIIVGRDMNVEAPSDRTIAPGTGCRG
jgi:hypothetical protein